MRSLPFPSPLFGFAPSCYCRSPDRRSWAISAFPICAEIVRFLGRGTALFGRNPQSGHFFVRPRLAYDSLRRSTTVQA